MATTVDERIVAAKFDASDFEKGVDKTLKKLDELKKGLDFKEATKGVKELAEKTEVSTDSMSKSLEKLTERFTTFAGMIKQKILGGLADEVANVFLHMEQSVKGFIKSISSDQVRAGMAKYEQMLTSVRIMMSAGESQSAAYGAIEQLQEYSDQTSYSLTQMTDALSKMRAAGVDLDTATKSVEGIANACANAGINATDAQRAFYNLSQAYAKGSLNYTDYKSLELLNMTTEKFKENMLEAAVEAGTLKKVSEGVYQTISTTDKKVKAGKKVTIQNLSEMLKYDFMNNQAMNTLFGKKFYFDEKEFRKYKKKYTNENGEVDRQKAIEEAKKDFGEVAVDAYLAAREARSFTDVINTLKDVVSTGWGTTFEYLFGKLEDAKDFFTELVEEGLADVVYKIGEYRNAILDFWNGGVDGAGGGEVFRQTILKLSDALGTLLKTFLSILPGFDELNNEEDEATPVLESLGDKLFVLTMRMRTLAENAKTAAQNFRKFMNEKIFDNGTTSRIEKIREIFTHLSAVFTIVGKVVVIAFSAITKAFYTLSPIFDGITQMLSKITEPLENLKNDTGVFKDLENSIDNILTILDPVAKTLGTIIGFLSEAAGFIAQMALDTFTSNLSFFADVLGFVMELFGMNSAQMKDGAGIIEGLRKNFEGIKEACRSGLSAVKEFFGALLGDLRVLFGLTEEAEEKSGNQKGGVFAGLTNFFNTNEFVQNAKKWVGKAIIDVGNFIKSIPERVLGLGANIYDTLRGLFFQDKMVYKGKDQWETKSILTPLGQWVDNAIKDIKEFVKSIPQKIIDGVGKVANWIDDLFDSWFGEKASTDTKKDKDEGKKVVDKNSPIIQRFEEFIQEAKQSISNWFKDLPKKISAMFKSVGNFLGNLFASLDEFLFGKKVTRTIGTPSNSLAKPVTVTERYKKGFSKWLDGVIQEVKKFIKNIPEYIKNGIKGAGDIISTVVGALFGKPEDKDVTSKDVEDKIAKPFLGINLTNVLNAIKDIGKELLNQIIRIFTGDDNVDVNMAWFANKIGEGIKWIRDKAIDSLDYVLDFLVNLPSMIASVFKQESTDNQEKGPIGKAISGFGDAIGKFIEKIPTKALELVDNVVAELDNIWEKIYSAISGDAEEKAEEAKENSVEAVDAVTGAAPTLTGWQKFVKKLGETISGIWEKLPTWIAEGLDVAIGAIDDLIKNIGDWLMSTGVEEKTEKSAEQVVTQTMEGTADAAVKGEQKEESRLQKAINNVGAKIRDLLVETLPTFFGQAWTKLSELGSSLWEGLVSLFSGQEVEGSTLGQAVSGFGDAIKNFIITDIPNGIKEAFKYVKRLVTGDVWAKNPLDERGFEKSFAYDSGFSDLAAGIGTSIRDLFVKHIPEKLNQVWELIKTGGKIVWTSAKNIFEGTPTNDFEKGVISFGQSIYKFITEEIPKYIRDALEFIGNLFSSKETDPLKNLNGAEKRHIQEYVDELKKHSKEADGEIKQSNIWSFFDTIKDGLLKGLKDLGPAILNGLATAVDWIGKLALTIADVFTGKKDLGEEIEKSFDKETPDLKASLKRIGESLRNFFLETLPTFIGSAIGAIAKEVGPWLHKLFDAMGKAAQDEADKNKGGGAERSFDEAVKSATGIMDIVKQLFENLKTWVGENKDFLEIMGVIIALSIMFNKLADLFGLADEFEEAGYALKWTAITLAIVAISGIMSFISEIVNSGEDDKIEHFEGIIDKLAGLFEKIAWVVGLLSLGKIADAIGEFGGKKSAGKLTVGEKLLGGLSDAISGFFKAIGIGAGTYVVGGLVNATIDTTTNTLADSFTTLSEGVSDALNIIAPFIDQLVVLNDKIDTATGVAEKLKGLFAIFMQVFGTLYTENVKWEEKMHISEDQAGRYILTDSKNNIRASGPIEELMGMEAFTKEMSDRMDLFVKLAAFIDTIASSLSRLEGITDLEGKMDAISNVLITQKFRTFMTDLFNVLSEAFGASDLKFGDFGGSMTTFLSKQTGIALALEILGDALSIFGSGIVGLNEGNIDAFDKMLNVFEKLYGALGDVDVSQSSLSKAFLGDNSLSKLGSEIKLFGMHMKQFYEYVRDIPGFKDNEVELTTSKIDSVVKVATGFATALNLLKGVIVGAQVSDFGAALPTLGDKMGEFVSNMNAAMEGITPEQLSMVTDATNAISSLSSIMQLFPTNAPTAIIDSMYTAMTGDNSTKLAGTLRLFINAIRDALVSEDSHKEIFDVGKTLAGFLVEGMQDSLTNDPTLRITPVLNMETARDQLRQFFGMDQLGTVDLAGLAAAVSGANANTEADRVRASELYARLANLGTDIRSISENAATVGDVTAAFAGMKIITDTGVLAGEITDEVDARIGAKIWLIEQGIAPA